MSRATTLLFTVAHFECTMVPRVAVARCLQLAPPAPQASFLLLLAAAAAAERH